VLWKEKGERRSNTQKRGRGLPLPSGRCTGHPRAPRWAVNVLKNEPRTSDKGQSSPLQAEKEKGIREREENKTNRGHTPARGAELFWNKAASACMSFAKHPVSPTKMFKIGGTEKKVIIILERG
jgi:hypothetical protein